MNLHCPNCDTPIPAQNINVQQMVAVCPKCSTVFNFASEQQPKRLKRKVKAPEDLQIQQTDKEWVVTSRLHTKTVGWIFFFGGVMVLGGAFLFFHLSNTHYDPFIRPIAVGLAIFFALGSVFLMSSPFVTFAVVINDKQLHVELWPVSLRPRSPLKRHDIRQLYCKGYARNAFALFALTITGESVLLLGSLSEEYALYLEQILEDYLGIEDMPVRGEY